MPHQKLRRTKLISKCLLLAGLSVTATAVAQERAVPFGPGPGQDPMIPATAPQKISNHVYVITAFPNIAFILGDRAELVVDTGLGARNGATVAKAAKSLAANHILYLTTTHFHPEHASGEGGFPRGTILIRNAAQQKELEDDNMAMVQRFSQMTPRNAELLQGFEFRQPDVVYDKEATVDLGGVTVRLFWLGAAHTLGDELIDVEPDRTLVSGDVVQNKVLPNLPSVNSNLKSWVNILAELRSLRPLHIVPDHSPVGDASLIDHDYELFSNLLSRSLDLKRQGKSAEEAGRILLPEFKAKYPDWPNLNGIPSVVERIYAENP
jgi:glyoxylase-like metal-dependent hydrolase (beta-lactamase superfamily II)